MKLNAFWLKIIALISMTIDHYGYFLEPNVIEYRIIGRLAFVIFAYFVANAYIYTSNRLKYGITLLCFGLIIDLFLIITNNYIFSNIFITLACGYFLIYSFDKEKYYLSIALLIVTLFVNMDYGLYGIVLILVCYLYFNEPIKIAVINLVLVLIAIYTQEIMGIQIFSTFGILLLLLYNREKGYNIKYLFYIYYPLHIVILGFLASN
ncbi:hypothetical protein OKW23_000767 [Bacilli bacterium PM5-9]|nr:hypothetical protein [Bacilli bacterium PM5-9]